MHHNERFEKHWEAYGGRLLHYVAMCDRKDFCQLFYEKGVQDTNDLHKRIFEMNEEAAENIDDELADAYEKISDYEQPSEKTDGT